MSQPCMQWLTVMIVCYKLRHVSAMHERAEDHVMVHCTTHVCKAHAPTPAQMCFFLRAGACGIYITIHITIQITILHYYSPHITPCTMPITRMPTMSTMPITHITISHYHSPHTTILHTVLQVFLCSQIASANISIISSSFLAIVVCPQITMPEAGYISAVPALSTALSAPHIRFVYEVCVQFATSFASDEASGFRQWDSSGQVTLFSCIL